MSSMLVWALSRGVSTGWWVTGGGPKRRLALLPLRRMMPGGGSAGSGVCTADATLILAARWSSYFATVSDQQRPWRTKGEEDLLLGMDISQLLRELTSGVFAGAAGMAGTAQKAGAEAAHSRAAGGMAALPGDTTLVAVDISDRLADEPSWMGSRTLLVVSWPPENMLSVKYTMPLQCTRDRSSRQHMHQQPGDPLLLKPRSVSCCVCCSK